MGLFHWVNGNWFDLLQTIGIIGGLFFTAYSIRKEESSRKITNLIAVKEQHREIWKDLYDRPKLSRVLNHEVDLERQPISHEEFLFVKLLILHLDTVHRALKTGMFVKLEGLQKDIVGFFSSPIPQKVWEEMKNFQDEDFVHFVEESRRVR